MHVVPIKPQGLHGKSAIFRDCTVFYFSWVCSRLKVILKYQISRNVREFSDCFILTIFFCRNHYYNLVIERNLQQATLARFVKIIDKHHTQVRVFFFSAGIITSATYTGLKLSSLGVYILFPSTAHSTPHRSNRKRGKNRWEIKFIFLSG